jgi:AMMECR1 domain-containing protein
MRSLWYVTLFTTQDCHDWEVGKHGILISFTDKGGTNYSATYLPEVAHEQGMCYAN